MSTGRDVKKDQLVCSLIIVAQGQLHWIAHRPQSAILSATKLNPTSDLSIMNVQTGNDTACEHGDRKDERRQGTDSRAHDGRAPVKPGQSLAAWAGDANSQLWAVAAFVSSTRPTLASPPASLVAAAVVSDSFQTLIGS